jgi:hypothetical protein
MAEIRLRYYLIGSKIYTVALPRGKWSDAETEEHRLKIQGAQFVPTEACSLLLFSSRSLDEQCERKQNLSGDMMYEAA